LKKIRLFLLFPLLCTSAKAAQWNICDLAVKVLTVNAAQEKLRVTVQKIKHSTAHAQCPSPGQIMEFVPETPDYQTTLPHKRWPHVAETAALQYRYLDGICKPNRPCRIVHYSVLR
jgi:hypothetical protein